jgi:hypothetical protein
MDDPDLKLLAGIVIVILLGAAAWYYWDEIFAPPAPETPVSLPVPAATEAEEGPRYPMPEPAGDPVTGELVPLPALDDSDSYFLLEVEGAFGSAIESLLVREGVIDRLVASVDSLARSELPERIRPVGALQDAFEADTGPGETVVLGISSYARYDALVAQIYYADIDAVYDTYRRFYPLFQKAYERLGYPNAYFNDRLIEVIDHLLATPEPGGPIVLVRPNVLYEFADPDLEALSSGQKLMLRMGPDNAATLKRRLENFRSRLAADRPVSP